VSDTRDDYATIKYDAQGSLLWERRYDGPDTSYDEAVALAVDASGNVYVTGTSNGDYATVKYSADGEQIWVQRYDRGNATAIAVDAAGNVYVTGRSPGWDYATVKYSADGEQIWVQRYNGPGNGYDEAKGIAVDSFGNVYVTGVSKGGSGTGASDYATIKYDADGEPSATWPDIGFGAGVRRYNGPGNSSDEVRALALDSSGNAYLTGRSVGVNTSWDYATVKYDVDGHELWVKRYNRPGNELDAATALALDGAGNVYVTGETGTGSSDYTTVKYDANGHELWVEHYNRGPRDAEDVARALAVDTSGNVYVTGKSDNDYATVKYDVDGHELWVHLYNGPVSGKDDAFALAVDGAGNVYVTGESHGGFGSQGTREDYATIKYVQVPAAPSDLSATAISANQIDLVWADNAGNEDGFKIERWNEALGEYEEITTVEANVTSFSDTDLSAETTYVYRVRAFNVAGNSDYSNEAGATTAPWRKRATH
jgi:hypothetical protein